MAPQQGTPSPSNMPTPPSLPFRVGCGYTSASTQSSLSPSVIETIRSLGSSTSTVEGTLISPSIVATSVPKKRKWNSSIWKEFDLYDGGLFEDGVPRALCKYCKGGPILASSDVGTSNFKRHLDKCEYVSGIEKISKNEILLHRFDSKLYKEMIALAIIRHGYPFTFAEHEANRNIHSFLHQGFQPISRNTAKNHIMKIHKRERGRLRELMHKVSGKICLTSDMWTSVVEQGHFIDDEWNLHAKILDFCHVEPPHTAAKLHDRVLGLLNNWAIGNKVFSITLDNARCNDSMQTLLTQSLSVHNSLPCDGKYFHVRCSAHILNLIVQEGLKVIDDAVAKVRKLVVWTVGSERRKLKFKEIALYVGIDCSKNLCLDCPTRWNSTYKMLDRAMVYRKAFEKSVDRSDSNFPPLPADEEWGRIEKICALLSPFDDLTTLMSGRQYCTSNLYFTNVWNIELLLLTYASSEDEFLKRMALKMKAKFDKYWASYSMILSFAAMLDPRYKTHLILYCFKKLDPETASSKTNHIKTQLYKLYEEYAVIFGPQLRGATSMVQDKCVDALRGYSTFEDFSSDKSELDAYLQSTRMDYTQELDVLNWWKENARNYPVVSQMAKDILAIPITTVALESALSMGNRVLTKWRASLDPDTADALLSTRSWLYGFDIKEDVDNQEIHGLEFQFSTNEDNNQEEEIED